MRHPGLVHALRSFVVQTADAPVAGSAYRAIYARQTERARALLGGIDGVDAVFIRASKPFQMAPGLSDIDVVAVLDDARPVAVELAAVEHIGRVVRRLNRFVPLVREVHAFTRRELSILARLHHGLYGILFDSIPIVEGASGAMARALPPLSDAPDLAREALLRELCFRTSRTLLHLFDDSIVGRGLAARAHAKSVAAATELESGARSSEGLWRAYTSGERTPASYDDVLALFRRIDRSLGVLPEAPAVTDDEPRRVPPELADAARAVERWFAPLSGLPALHAAVLSVEGARASDLRFYVAVDPAHSRAAETLSRVGRAWRAGGFPAGGRSRRFSRFPWPVLVTPAQLARTVLLRWTAAEPVARLRHAVVIAGEPSAPRATRGEIVRGLVLDWVGSAARVREVLAGETSARNVACVRDALFGLSPALRTLAASDRIVTRLDSAAPSFAALERSLAERPKRLEALSLLRETVDGPCAALLDAGAPAHG